MENLSSKKGSKKGLQCNQGGVHSLFPMEHHFPFGHPTAVSKIIPRFSGRQKDRVALHLLLSVFRLQL